MALVCAALLCACSAPLESPPAPVAATALPFTPLAQLASSQSGEVTTIGYLIEDKSGARLVDAISFVGQAPAALTPPSAQVWCGDAGKQVSGALLAATDVRYGLVVVEGRLEGPGAFGPGGQVGWQIRSPRVRPIAPQETSIAALLSGGPANARRLVRLNGYMLVREGQAVLVDQLGRGGIPEPNARQVKLRRRYPDAALDARLPEFAGGTLRAGLVQIEGYMSEGALTVLAIRPLGQQ
jgi:hypothetical protein